MSDLPGSPATHVARFDDYPWACFIDGIEVKVLRANLIQNSYTLLSRFAPGVRLPRHKHFGDVHAYTISGRWHYLEYDWWATPGGYVYEPAGAIHTLDVPEDATEPALILFVVNNGMALINDEGEIWMLEDAAAMVERYVQVLEANGQPVPKLL